jgi:hypothetical protein
VARRATSTKQAAPEESGPVSVVLPIDLKVKVEAEAQRRGLRLSPTVRALLQERVEEIEDGDRLRAAETFQREQALATWEEMKAGDLAEVTGEQIDAEFDQALRATSPQRSR